MWEFVPTRIHVKTLTNALSGSAQEPLPTELLRGSISERQSAIEEAFFWDFLKVAEEELVIEREKECDVGYTSYRLDFLIMDRSSGATIGIECDGKAFHSVERDSRRDLAILSTGLVDQIVRIPGRDLWHRMHDVFQMINMQAPWLFSGRGVTNIHTLAAREHLREDGWNDVLRGAYREQVREYQRPAEDTELFYQTKAWEYVPTRLLWIESKGSRLEY